MNETDLYIARTQRQLAFLLIWVLVLLVAIVCAVLLIPGLRANQEITGLLIQVVTGVLALAGTAIGYFFARHRPPTPTDEGAPPSDPKASSNPILPQSSTKEPPK